LGVIEGAEAVQVDKKYRAELVEAGARVSLQYTPERILPQWQAFLDDLARTRTHAAR
jgi:hypothetical protein